MNASKESFAVQLGTVFRTIFEDSPLRIVTDMAGGNSVGASAIQTTEDGRKFIVCGAGSTGADYIQELVERWDIERMRVATILGIHITGVSLPG